MGNVIGAIVAGLLVGAAARWFYPGAVEMGWLATIALGVGGSLLAGLVTTRGRREFHRAGCLASILGAMALILAGHLLGIG
ncbi:MAG: GlsB/YeaQ/YmgE family stress response membrane protein [Croceibacterium sp.]